MYWSSLASSSSKEKGSKGSAAAILEWCCLAALCLCSSFTSDTAVRVSF